MIRKISGRVVTHEKDFLGIVEWDSATGLILGVREYENAKAFLNTGPEDDEIRFDPSETVIFPGFGDIHIHAREDESGKHVYKEDFISASAAAVNGGVIHVADMPNNPIPPVDESTYSKKRKLADRSPIHITLYAGIGPNTKPLKQSVPYKVFMGPSIGELFFHDNRALEDTIRVYAGENISFHCEDPEILEKHQDEKFHEDRRPTEAETTATDFALYLIEKYNLRGKLCHYSTAEGLNKIKLAKQKGIRITCEVTPTHLFFDKSMLTSQNRHWFQMNPPLRDKEDRERMLEGVKQGWIDYLATDHAPHSVEEKHKGVSGISQLDTYSLFVTWLILKAGVELKTIARICAKNPGDFVNEYLPGKFGKGFGEIEAGYSANFTVLNLKKPKKFLKEEIKSKSGWSPFENFEFPGSIEAVFFRGFKVK
ncbi:amidohydrolase family protein [Leptospira santarosai]|uniref:amidohydrolase family protein n=1 Tax=Leptospira santarosai TaxID=28183 RepID=UPI00062D507E|nr:amidohydrolase family protein [Leptospira santarosai]AVV77968.1 Dihydroorotase [Leptospira santarosai]MBW9230956.1 amidohydrolase family protein [Leptospira santarosai]MDI7218968.1 amidohydrolase family protein [Leptospira santarosai]MDO6392609.1 amidohydrolase family protein [Leptospira santarosai]ONF89296.1 amidohydrolase [Leptospira santarosai serovar Grippotyphosa]